MEETREWALRLMVDFLRHMNDESMVQAITAHLFEITSPDELRTDLFNLLGVEESDTSQAALLSRAKKLEFIDELTRQRFFSQTKKNKKKNEIKVQMNKKNIESIHKVMTGPAFISKRQCDCMATEHELLGNCLACGKIVCAIEGVGSCMFCGHQILSKGQQLSSLPDSSYTTAVSQKNRLIDYDRNAEERLAVIDDQTD